MYRGGYQRRAMGFYQYHRYFNPMHQQRSGLKYRIPSQIQHGKMALSPLSKHLLMQHEYDSDSLDGDVQKSRGRRRKETESEYSQSDYAEDSQRSEEEESARYPQHSKRHSRASYPQRGASHGHKQQKHRGRKQPVYDISSEEEGFEDGGHDGGESDAGSDGQMEILELEMRARAIKAMLKAQEELDKAEKLRAHMNKAPGSASRRQRRRSHGGATSDNIAAAQKPGKTFTTGTTKGRTKKKVVVRKIVKKKSRNAGIGKERQLAQDILEEATSSTSGQLQHMKK